MLTMLTQPMTTEAAAAATTTVTPIRKGACSGAEGGTRSTQGMLSCEGCITTSMKATFNDVLQKETEQKTPSKEGAAATETT